MSRASGSPLDPSPSQGICARRGLLHGLLKNVDHRNLSIGPGSTQVALDSDWQRMLAELEAIGNCLRVSRNPAAVLGLLSAYPCLEFAADGKAAGSWAGGLEIDFVPWDAAVAVAEERGCCVAHHIDFCDSDGDVLHRVCLSEGSDLGAYLEWVVRNQRKVEASEKRGSAPFSMRRWCTVPQRHWLDYDEISEIPPRLVERVFEAARNESMPIGCFVGNHSVVQAAAFVPLAIRPASDWLFVSDDQVGLHFDPEGISSALVHHGAEQPPSLKIFDDSGSLCLALMSPAGRSAEDWSDFLRRLTDAPIS